jgi:hypothetical protein
VWSKPSHLFRAYPVIPPLPALRLLPDLSVVITRYIVNAERKGNRR